MKVCFLIMKLSYFDNYSRPDNTLNYNVPSLTKYNKSKKNRKNNDVCKLNLSYDSKKQKIHFDSQIILHFFSFCLRRFCKS